MKGNGETGGNQPIARGDRPKGTWDSDSTNACFGFFWNETSDEIRIRLVKKAEYSSNTGCNAQEGDGGEEDPPETVAEYTLNLEEFGHKIDIKVSHLKF